MTIFTPKYHPPSMSAAYTQALHRPEFLMDQEANNTNPDQSAT